MAPVSRLAAVAILMLSFANVSCSSDSTTSGASVTQTIGPEGGTITVGGATMTIPPNALALARQITITSGKANPPAGYVALSPVFTCEPSGTEFASPVSMQIPFSDDGKGPATVFWSSQAQPAFQDVGGTVQGGTMVANVMHFSSGFVGRKGQ